MARSRTLVRCTECGRTEPRWVGRCPDCATWGSMLEETAPAPTVTAARRARDAAASVPPARKIADVPFDGHARAATGIRELDRVLGGGLVPGSVTLLGGEPGAGKSTLLLQAADALARTGRTVLYVSAEESPGQVRLRAERLGALDDRLLLAGETEIPAVAALVEAHQPEALILDSIQTVRMPDVAGLAGGVGQVRECAAEVVRLAKSRDMATVLVGHVTKEGQLAGPRVLEHLADAVLDLTGDRHHALRLLRASKNRYGAVGEVGCFEMTTTGLAGIDDVGRLFLGDNQLGTTGIAVTLTLEGQRPLACEVQALAVPTKLANPRRVASGLDGQRLALLIAVLGQKAAINLHEHDVYASSVGGVRLVEPGVDLALCLAIASSFKDRPVAPDLVALAEVGLAGELRPVAQTERRLAEAARLGFRRALLPGAYDGADSGMHIRRARSVHEALAICGDVDR